MEALFQTLDYLAVGAAAVGGALAALWIYNSTLKERRELIRRFGKRPDGVVRRELERGAFFHKLTFCAAAAATAGAILWFAYAYRRRYGADIAPAYITCAALLAAVGILTAVVLVMRRRKE